MGLELNIKQQKSTDCTAFQIVETTGAYDQYTNPTGYNYPNVDGATATIEALVVTDTNGLNNTITRYNGMPVSYTNDVVAEILNTDLGLASDALIPDGIYKITYTIRDNGSPLAGLSSTYTIEKNVLVSCQVECCLDKKLLAIRVPNCDCEVEDINNLDIAFMMLQAAELAIECDKIALGQSNLEFVQKFCNFEECKTCH